jgi:hypothetical protein
MIISVTCSYGNETRTDAEVLITTATQSSGSYIACRAETGSHLTQHDAVTTELRRTLNLKYAALPQLD